MAMVHHRPFNGIIEGNKDGSPVTVIDGKLDINGDGMIDANEYRDLQRYHRIGGVLDSRRQRYGRGGDGCRPDRGRSHRHDDQ